MQYSDILTDTSAISKKNKLGLFISPLWQKVIFCPRPTSAIVHDLFFSQLARNSSFVKGTLGKQSGGISCTPDPRIYSSPEFLNSSLNSLQVFSCLYFPWCSFRWRFSNAGFVSDAVMGCMTNTPPISPILLRVPLSFAHVTFFLSCALASRPQPSERKKKKHRTPSWLRAPAANIKEAAPPLTSTRALHHDLQLKSVAK